MPSLSPTMTKGSLLKWHVKEGTTVESGDTIAEIETDKATMDYDAIEEGIMAKILIVEGTKDIEVGTPIAVLVEEEKDIGQFKDYKVKHDTQSLPDPIKVVPKMSADPRVKIGPAARKLATERGLDLGDVHATGPKGIITKEDILNAKPSPTRTESPVSASKPKESAAVVQQPVQGVDYVDIPLTQMRRVIAKRLLESKTTIPGIYFTVDCDLTEIDHLRQTLKASGTKVSVNDFITRAVALSLRDVPSANAYWHEKEEKIKTWPSVDVSIAVSTPAGLITPIVKAADTKSIKAIAAEIRELAEKARNNKLKPEEFMGGTFTISNLGMYGISHFSAIINPPQSCIMAVGGSRSEVQLSASHQLEAVSRMSVTLTADQRVFDGEIAHHFLDAFRNYMEHPMPLLV